MSDDLLTGVDDLVAGMVIGAIAALIFMLTSCTPHKVQAVTPQVTNEKSFRCVSLGAERWRCWTANCRAETPARRREPC